MGHPVNGAGWPGQKTCGSSRRPLGVWRLWSIRSHSTTSNRLRARARLICKPARRSPRTTFHLTQDMGDDCWLHCSGDPSGYSAPLSCGVPFRGSLEASFASVDANAGSSLHAGAAPVTEATRQGPIRPHVTGPKALLPPWYPVHRCCHNLIVKTL